MALTQGQQLQLAGEGSFYASKSMTFAGGTLNDPGDFDGTGTPATLFTVTGTVYLKIVATCSADLVGATATVAVGTVGNTGGLMASTVATTITTGEVWDGGTASTALAFNPSLASTTSKVMTMNIVQTVGTANITAGTLLYHVFWMPISDGATVTAA